MFTSALINHPESFNLDLTRIDEIFRLVSIVSPVSLIPDVPVIPSYAGIQELQESGFRNKSGMTGTSSERKGQKLLLDNQNGIINIAFLSDEEIQELNNIHRGIDKNTDVLSFHYFDDFSQTQSDEIAGEVIMSESKIIAQSLDYGHSACEEFEILLIHSLLHLLGYDHEEDRDYEIMIAVEKEIREKMGLNIKR